MNALIKTIAVDLTPILPGGKNGGAKLFVLELLCRLAEMAPNTKFVLLTHAVAHEELSIMDRNNMTRLLVAGSENKQQYHSQALIIKILSRISRLFNRLVQRVKLKANDSVTQPLLHNIGADLLFCPFTAPSYFVQGIPTVCTIYDLQYKTFPDFFTAEDVAQRNNTFVDACQRANRLVAISDYSRQSVLANADIKPEGIRTIHIRMAQRILPKMGENQDVLDHFGLIGKQYFIYPANYWKHKNHERLLAAFKIACDEGLNTNIKLVCSGAPCDRQVDLENSAKNMGISDRFLCVGYVSNAELSVLMANCGGMVYPSLFEGFGLPVIEAMAAGVPVACSHITSLPEIAGNAAIFFDPYMPAQIAQAMITLLHDKQLREDLVLEGRRQATEFADTNRMAREYWDTFVDAYCHNEAADMPTKITERHTA